MSLKEELNGRFHMYSEKNGIILPENQLLIDAAKAKKVKEEDEMLATLRELDDKKQAEIETQLSKLELIPEGNRVIILPYPTNPYKKIKAGSIYLGNDGSFKNPDTGEMDNLQEFIVCGKIIEVGPDCKRAIVGNDIFYIKNSAVPIPFMSLGYVSTNEPNIIVHIGEGLKEKFKM